jgi:hypothetical protein
MTDIDLTLKFTGKEIERLTVLQRRLDYLRDLPVPEDGYAAAEAGALAWALHVLIGTVEPLEIRMNKLDAAMRKVHSRLGRLESVSQ